ncbi:cold shock domain-containing protein [uncultured Endozoicomonas sp.]|uniref:cold shock domain-containing protein n=1 Tax=uncultured Endozoicomonas sp. TaxID=432652 RepID=UPI00261676C1|nr:cold shock domain-containing protein [uncultured Endozoicomonas sp.]
MKGNISQWNDDKGFGFITIPDKNGRLFFHISSVKTTTRRPVVGDAVDFVIGKDKSGKLRATSVLISGLTKNISSASKRIVVEPPKKDFLDILLTFIILGSLGFTGYQYYLIQDPNKIWAYAIPAVIAFLASGRTKKPKQSHFSCAKCKTAEKFSSRTIEAWNRKFTRLYCNRCHREWVKNQPRDEAKHFSTGRGSSGCLGSFIVLISLPVLAGAAIFKFVA